MGHSEAKNVELSKHVESPKDFTGIEEVFIPTEGDDILKAGAMLSCGIRDVSSSSKDIVTDSDAASTRRRVATAIMLLWGVWTIVSLVVYLYTGNTVLLVTQPAIMTIPLYKVVGYYF